MAHINLRFGIPSLDAILIGETERRVSEAVTALDGGGILLSEKSEGTSVCLIGPDGTGKSVFSMHLASQYLWDSKGCDATQFPKVIYVSTDLRYEMAERVFSNFQLGGSVTHRGGVQPPNPVCLRPLPTGDTSKLTDFLLTDSQNQIGFVDLASDSAGDDWALVTRIVSLLPEQEGPAIRHLLVVDAVEGLETLAGETDAYGQKVSRRARIALLMRLAAHKCHIALIVEETKEGTRLPEEFVADIVIRLRSTLVNGYTRRTLEIEKARGQAHHARGQHPFQIRPGDELMPPHITVYPSLHYQGNSLERRRKKDEEAKRLSRSRQSTSDEAPEVVSFGIRHLDTLLKHGRDGRFGLHAGMPFAMIGDKGTWKSHLADSFVAGCLADLAQQFSAPTLDNEAWRRCWIRPAECAGVAVLCSSKPREDLHRSLTRQLLNSNPRASWLLRQGDEGLRRKFEEHVGKAALDRIHVDSLVIQDQPGPRLYHRIERLIHNAKKKLSVIPGISDKYQRIRLVFDDISGFRDAYPELHEDPLLLPLVIQLTRLEGVSALLVATQAMQPNPVGPHPFDAGLLAQVEGYLSTWRVSFFGEARTAITFVAGTESDRQPTVRQVLQLPRDSDAEPLAADVDPEFELYDGLEIGRPEPVPLEIRLYLETPAFREYVDHENELLKELFRAAVCSGGNAEVITGVGKGGYDALRDYCYLNASGKLLNTLILQIDEFWRPAKRLGMLFDLEPYVTATVDGADGPDRYEDPYSVFRTHPGVNESAEPDPPVDKYPPGRSRRDFFPEFRRPGPKKDVLIDRVPFMWDFGFLLLSHNDWYSAADTRLPILSKSICESIRDRSAWEVSESQESEHLNAEFWRANALRDERDPQARLRFPGLTVGTVLDGLRTPAKHLEARSVQVSDYDRRVMAQLATERALFRGPSSWRAVLEAAAEVKRRRTSRDTTVIRPFDLARPSAESFSSLVLEIWFSEILERRSWRMRRGLDESGAERREAEKFIKNLNDFEPDNQFSLEYLIDHYWLELYMTWMLLVEALDFDCLIDRDKRFSLKETPDATPAMATRHWYKTAAEADSSRYSEEPAMPARLPGYFSTRGDWHLAMAAGSRSYRLGTRALDLLSSRRANITRLQHGLGLPVRDIVDPKAFEKFRTKLSYVNYRGRRSTVDYASLVAMGGDETRRYLCESAPLDSPDAGIDIARTLFTDDVTSAGNSFYWIWRSRIKHFDRHARIWGKWLIRVALLMQGIKNDHSAVWRNGYEVYDSIALADGVPDFVTKLRSYKRFEGMRDFLKLELGWTTPKEVHNSWDSPHQP